MRGGICLTDQALDDLARRVILDAARLEYGDWIDELPEQDFSPEFEKKMKKLVRRANHPIRYRVVQTAACILLAALLSGCAVLAVSPEAREVFSGWVRKLYTLEEYPPFYRYTYTGEGDAVLPDGVAYRPTWVPEGCQLFDENHNLPYRTTILFEDAEGGFVDFLCVMGTGSGGLQVTIDEGDVLKKVQVNGLPAELHQGSYYSLVWSSKDGELLFWIAGDVFTEESLLRMAESVCLTQPRQPPHRPSWHPEEFYLEGSRCGSDGLEVHFSDGEGRTIYSHYTRYSRVEEMRSEIQEAMVSLTPRIVQVQGGDAELYEGEDSSYLVWPTEDGLYWIYGPVEGEILLRIAESMGVDPNPMTK